MLHRQFGAHRCHGGADRLTKHGKAFQEMRVLIGSTISCVQFGVFLAGYVDIYTDEAFGYT